MPGDDAVVRVDQDRVGESELSDDPAICATCSGECVLVFRA
jgi:hypothetical protein